MLIYGTSRFTAQNAYELLLSAANACIRAFDTAVIYKNLPLVGEAFTRIF